MRLFADLVMIGWVPIVLILFAILPPRRAAIIAVIGGWLFLPVIAYPFKGLPDYDKVNATTLAVFLGALIFDGDRLLRLRPRWYDMPVIIWCVCPFVSSLTNGLGMYDGLSAVRNQLVDWGMPYLVGRAYFGDLDGLREWAIGVVSGGIIYMPLCLFEIRMSPTLHRAIYGFMPRDTRNGQWEYGGWRPIVFMEFGLPLCLFMVTAAVMGIWLWRCGTIDKLWGISLKWLVPPLAVTAVMCRGVGSIGLMIVGLLVLFVTKWSRWRGAIILLAVVSPVYYTGRISGLIDHESVSESASHIVGLEKSRSLKVRMWQEYVVMERILKRPLFGWGAWGRFRVIENLDEEDAWGTGIRADSNQLSGVDSQWLNVFGRKGFVGLISYTLMFLLPAAMTIRRVPGSEWGSSLYGPVTGCSLFLLLVLTDYLLNGIHNPIAIVTAGGLTACIAQLGNPSATLRSANAYGDYVKAGGRRQGAVTTRMRPR